MPKSAAQIGRNNRRAGHATEAAGLDVVRGYFPAAARSREGQAGGDFTAAGVGDRVMEITRASWDKAGAKLDQARDAAAAAELVEYGVLKLVPGRGAKGPRWHWISDADPMLALMREVDQLRAAAIDVQAAYDRGYNSGWAARGKAGTAELGAGEAH
jgi:hypothetical protein